MLLTNYNKNKKRLKGDYENWIYTLISRINHLDEIYISTENRFNLVSMLIEIIELLNRNNFSKLEQQFP